MLTRKGWRSIIERISERNNFDEETINDLESLKNDFEEKESVLRKYGNEYDEDIDEYTFTEKTVLDSTEDYKAKYEDIKKKYLDRFFGGETKEVERVEKNVEEDVKKDGEEKSFDELFKEMEG